jgi:hypothetical protein
VATMNTEFGQFIIHRPEKARSACRIFVSKNFPERERLLGKLFGIIEIETETPDKRKYQILDSIINELENNFYYRKRIDSLPAADERPEKINIESCFEDTLKILNDKIINLLQGGEIYRRPPGQQSLFYHPWPDARLSGFYGQKKGQQDYQYSGRHQRKFIQTGPGQGRADKDFLQYRKRQIKPE